MLDYQVYAQQTLRENEPEGESAARA
jgi:hypothetical protein